MNTARLIAIATLAGLPALAGWADVTVNKSIHVRDGETRDGGFSSVNGSINIGDGCKIEGGCNSVNGRIDIGDDVEVESLRVVNGAIRVGEGAVIDGDVTTVNGSISIESGSNVDGNLTTVNGSIQVEGVTIKDDVSTVNGRIELEDNSVVEGDVIIHDANNWSRKKRELDIYITGESRVEGSIINEDEDAVVTVHLEEGSQVVGEMRNVTVNKKDRPVDEP